MPRGGWRPGITGEADHPGDPGVTKPHWAPSSSPFLSGAPRGRRSRLGASVRSGAPAGRAPMLHTQPVRLHLQAQVFSLRHEASASRADAGGGNRKAGHPSRNHPLPPLSMPSTWTPAAWGPGTAGSPIPEAVWCQQHARFVLYVARRELTVVSGCSRCPGESLGRVRPRMGGRWGGGQRKRESPEVSWERRPEDRLTARPGSAQARLLQRGLWRLLAEPERGAGDAGRRGRRNRCVRRGNSLENRLCSRCR